MKNILFTLTIMLSFQIQSRSQNFTIPLWEKNVPNYQKSDDIEKRDTTDIVRISKVQTPDIAVFLPSKKNTTGEAVLICPGGGYRILAYDWEGSDIAKYLNSKGITAIVLKYRLPEPASNIEPYKSPLLDAQRAMRMVRYYAGDWNIDPGKIGIMGFSAGGHLASTLSTHYDTGNESSNDPVEKMSCRPDFSVLVYPVITFSNSFMHSGSMKALLGENPEPKLITLFSNELQVTKDTPPTMLIHANDDKTVPVENSLSYFEALRKNGVSASMEIYPYGGHGFSLAINKGYLNTWPDKVIDWIQYINKK